jgi:hypothetical protein
MPVHAANEYITQRQQAQARLPKRRLPLVNVSHCSASLAIFARLLGCSKLAQRVLRMQIYISGQFICLTFPCIVIFIVTTRPAYD